MTQAKHTPGPWVYLPSKYDDWGFVRALPAPGGPLGHLVAVAKESSIPFELHDAHRANGTDPFEANARLIAAAPDLLAVAKAFQSYGCPVCGGDCSSANPPVYACPAQALDAAIAKAEGR